MSAPVHEPMLRPQGVPARSRRAAPLRSLSIDVRFLDMLRGEGLGGRVHSVFERVVNIACDRGDLYTFACRDVDDAPGTAILDVAGFGAMEIEVGDPVAGIGEELRIGDCRVVVPPNVAQWDRMLRCYPGASDVLRANLRALRAHLEHLGPAGAGLASRHPTDVFQAAIAELLEERTARLRRALAAADLASGLFHANSMLGLGAGLTPSGDDFLVGLFAVLNVVGSPCHGWLGGGVDVLPTAARSTHAISLAALAQAAHGRVRESIAALIDHLMYGPPERLAPPLRRVLSIGSTSGADIVAGIRFGFELNISHEGTSSCQSGS